MNLSQLYELRTNVKQNPNRTVGKNVFLALLDSHISALSGENDLQLVRDANEPEKALQTAYNHYALNRHPPVTIEQARKAYEHHI